MANISIGTDSEEIKEILLTLNVVPTINVNTEIMSRAVKVYVDGALVGYTNDPESIIINFKKMRRQGLISSEANIAYYADQSTNVTSKEIIVNCDSGRVRRPLIVVENGEPKLTQDHIKKLNFSELTWSYLINEGIIEYLDAEEEENTFIALTPSQITQEHTHLEIAPYTILGIATSIIPYAEYNQSPRNSYEAAMSKQALGIYSFNFNNRVDTQSHILHYPQIPLIKTKPMDVLGYCEKPSGQNFVVAVLSEGYNMEDALVFNKSSIDRGLARSSFFRIYQAESNRYLGGLQDKFEIPEAGTRGFRGEQYYRLLENDGLVSVSSQIEGNDVLVGRTSPPRFLEEFREFEVKGPTRRDTSITMKHMGLGIVDDVFLMVSSEGNELVKVRVRDQRIPELGDKFASRHGQKGVVGMILPHEDMPFTGDGIVPDVIINPHTFPSRMTIGQFVESIAGKAAALKGEIIDGTPFSNKRPEEIRADLQKLGFEHGGTEVMYNGITGEKFEAKIFIGLIYYQKLHHMVADKMHARARGQVQMLTRQPTEGRSRGGGLRFGEMERDCLIGHGAALLLKDRLLEESDRSMIYVCDTCGFLAYYNFKQRKYVCKICEDQGRVSTVVVSYAFKLLLQELMSLCISPKLLLRRKV